MADLRRIIVVAVGLVWSWALTVDSVFYNPCTSPPEGCGSGLSTDKCGYGSECISVLGNRATGYCGYLIHNLTCASPCPLKNLTEASPGTYPLPQACDYDYNIANECDKGPGDDYATCGLQTTSFAVDGCSCTSDSDCVSGTCTDGVCVVVSGYDGYPCTSNSSCETGVCLNNTCVGREFNASCSFSDQCAHMLSCYGPSDSLGAKTCQLSKLLGESCDPNGVTSKCAEHLLCNNITSTCFDRHSLPVNARCTSSEDCALGLACNGEIGATACSPVHECGPALGRGCPFGQTCGCPVDGGTTPTCIGTNLTESYVNATAAYRDCLFRYATSKHAAIRSVRLNSNQAQNAWQVPSECRCEFKQLFCVAEHAALIGPQMGVDYNLVDCCRGQWVPYDINQTAACNRTYCKAPFDQDMVDSCSVDIEDPCPSADEDVVADTVAASGLSVGAIVGITVGAVVGVFAAGVLIMYMTGPRPIPVRYTFVDGG
jgi:hypothetical protein